MSCQPRFLSTGSEFRARHTIVVKRHAYPASPCNLNRSWGRHCNEDTREPPPVSRTVRSRYAPHKESTTQPAARRGPSGVAREHHPADLPSERHTAQSSTVLLGQRARKKWRPSSPNHPLGRCSAEWRGRSSPGLVATLRLADTARTAARPTPGLFFPPPLEGGRGRAFWRRGGRTRASHGADPLPRRAPRNARLGASPTLAGPRAATAAVLSPHLARRCAPHLTLLLRIDRVKTLCLVTHIRQLPAPQTAVCIWAGGGPMRLARGIGGPQVLGIQHTRVRCAFLFFFSFCGAGRLYLGDGPRGHGAARAKPLDRPSERLFIPRVPDPPSPVAAVGASAAHRSAKPGHVARPDGHGSGGAPKVFYPTRSRVLSG